MLVRGIDANAALAARHPQQAAVQHGVEQMRRGVRRTAPVVLHRAVREMIVYFAGVNCYRVRARTQAKAVPSSCAPRARADLLRQEPG